MSHNNTIIDVRNADEFAKGHAAGSINIPLGELEQRLDEVRELAKEPLVLCCGGGSRSGRATDYLRAQGIACENGGSWKKAGDL